MIRKLSLALVLAMAAGSASAEGVRVTVTGKDEATLRHDLWQAARKACDAELTGSVLAYDLQQPCMRHAVQAAEAKIASGKLAANEGRGAGTR